MDEEHDVVWLCAVHRRQEGSDDDAYTWFAKLPADGMLLPSSDDRLRDRTGAVIRLQRGLTAALLRLVDDARSRKGSELNANLGGYLPCRVLVRGNGQIEEIWCALRVAPRRSAGCPLRAHSADARRWRRHRGSPMSSFAPKRLTVCEQPRPGGSAAGPKCFQPQDRRRP